jgi:hypothetical protein
MARMYPPALDLEPGFQRKKIPYISDAEKAVFQCFQETLSDDWDVFHSVWMRDSARGEHAEGDFSLVRIAFCCWKSKADWSREKLMACGVFITRKEN